MTARRTIKPVILALLMAAVVFAQIGYDRTKVTTDFTLPNAVPPEAVRMFDLGLHATVGSFLWVSTLPEVLDLFRGHTEYLSDFAYLTSVDPRFGYPYAFSVLVLPVVPAASGYTTGLADAMKIGQEGLQHADPDWRIPYYLATNYYLDYHDTKDAATYFNMAAQTPGLPYYAKRFAENFGIDQKDRDRTIALWESIRDTTNDPDTKARAQAYIDHLEIFNYLEAAVAEYKKQFGALPSGLGQLVAKGIIPEIPQDPFGYTFLLNPDGTVRINSDQ